MRRMLLAAGLLLGLLALTAGLATCASLGKDELERRLLDSPRGRAVAGALRRETLTLTLARGQREVEVSWLRRPRAGAPRVVLVHGTPGTLVHWMDLIDGGPDSKGVVEIG